MASSKIKGVISFDIGMKNLGVAMIWYSKDSQYCSVSPSLWTLVDFIKEDNDVCTITQKNGKLCGKKATYLSNSQENATCGKHKVGDAKLKKRSNCNKMSVQDIALKYLDSVPKLLDTVVDILKDKQCPVDVVMELQPKFNRKMTMICDWIYINLYERLLRHGIDTRKMYFMKAGMKLRESGLTYVQRKQKVCNLVSDFLTGKLPYHDIFDKIRISDDDKQHMLELFVGGKRDDLADSLIMAIRYITPPPSTKSTKPFVRRRRRKTKV